MTRHVLVTGGNRGIGLALVRALSARGDQVTFTSRVGARGDQALQTLRAEDPGRQVRMEICDLSSPPSIAACGRRLVEQAQPVDGVMHNAGVLRPPDRRVLTADGIEATLATNALGPWLLTLALAPVLSPQARIVILTSRLHQPGSRGTPVHFDFDDPDLDHGYDPDRAYKNSKLAAIWVARALDERLPPGVTVNAVCPGFVPATVAPYVTGWSRFLLRHVLPRLAFTRTVEEAAADVIWALDAPELRGVGGRYVADRAIAQPSADAVDPALAERFVTLAERLLSSR